MSEVVSSGASPMQPTDMSLLLFIIAIEDAPSTWSKPRRKFRQPVLTLALDADWEGESEMPALYTPESNLDLTCLFWAAAS